MRVHPAAPRAVDARAAYEKAQAGKASQLTPADLHDAKVALDSAEQAFNSDPKADGTKDWRTSPS